MAGFLLGAFGMALVAGMALLGARLWLCIVTVTGHSMEPSYRDGETVVATKAWPVRWLRRGSVVLIRGVAPLDGTSTCFFVKRVALLPGDRVTCKSELADVRQQLPKSLSANSPSTQTVARDRVFVVSDNLSGGFDSRSWGPIPVSSLGGLVLFRLGRAQSSN